MERDSQASAKTVEVESILEGGRNATLASLAGKMRRRGMEETEILDGLKQINVTRCQPPLPEHEVESIARSIAKYPQGDPPLTDSGNAELFARLYGDHIRWSAELGWLVYDGCCWTRDAGVEVLGMSKLVAREITTQADREPDEKRAKLLRKHARESESVSKRRAMVELLRAEPDIAISTSDLDTDAWLLNCQNGTLNLKTGRLQEHSPGDYITRSTRVSYEAKTCPEWEKFLEAVQPDASVRAYLQRLTGYWLTGVVRDHVLPIFYGTGSNGKR